MKHGELKEVDGRWRLRFERRLRHRPQRVWRALTEEEELATWFPTTIEGRLEAGAPLRFEFREHELDGFDGEVVACEEHRLLEFTWGEDRLWISLEPDGDGTRLTLVDWLDERGKGARDAAGWHLCLENLAAHLDGMPAPDPEGWKPLQSVYQERFGPEASTIGPPEGIA